MIRALTYFSTGYTEAPAFIAKGGGGLGMIRFHATCVLIEHATEGLILFDTGYTPRFHEITSRWPYRIHRWSTPVVAKPAWTIAQQLSEKGIAPTDIRHIIVSHFHSDHVGGLKDFPDAEIWSSRASMEYFPNKKGFGAVRHGFLPDLLPENLAERVQYFEDQPVLEEVPQLGPAYDLLGDGSIQMIGLPGHCRGQYGAWLKQGESQEAFLVSDAIWLEENLHPNQRPSRLIRLFIDDWAAYHHTIEGLNQFQQQHPKTELICCHSPRVFSEKVINQHLF